MTDRPILFSAPMVLALMDDRKTKTRRVLKAVVPPCPGMDEVSLRHAPHHPAPYLDSYCSQKKTDTNPRGMSNEWCWWTRDNRPGALFKVPFVPGDRLWVRETWADVNTSYGPGIGYRADCGFVQPEYDGPDFGAGPSFNYDKYPGNYSMWFDDLLSGAPDHKWKPSIFMPRWASRITLIVTDVRIERLQDISEADAEAEGLAKISKDGSLYKFGLPDRDGLPGNDDHGWPWMDWHKHARDAYQAIWQSLNAKRTGCGWDDNPWVAAITFNVTKANIDAHGEQP